MPDKVQKEPPKSLPFKLIVIGRAQASGMANNQPNMLTTPFEFDKDGKLVRLNLP